MDRRQENGRTAARTSVTDQPRVGDLLYIDRAASVQFRRAIHFRVIRVLDYPTYNGWVWLEGYQLNDAGEAVERRSVFVRVAGLRRVTEPVARPGRPGRAGRPEGPPYVSQMPE